MSDIYREKTFAKMCQSPFILDGRKSSAPAIPQQLMANKNQLFCMFSLLTKSLVSFLFFFFSLSLSLPFLGRRKEVNKKKRIVHKKDISFRFAEQQLYTDTFKLREYIHQSLSGQTLSMLDNVYLNKKSDQIFPSLTRNPTIHLI